MLVAPCRHVRSKQAAREVDHVPVLDIFWIDRLAANTRAKINRLRTLHSVDYASEMNIAQASIVSDTARLHNRLIHSRRTIKRNFARISGESRYDHGCRTVLQRDQHLGVFKVLIVAMDKLSLEVDDPLAGSGHFPKERQTYLAVPANFLRLI